MWNYSIFKRLQGRKTMEKPFLLLLMYSRCYACPLFLSSLPVWCHFIKCEVWWGSFFPCHNFHPCFPLFIALLSSFLLFLSLFGLIYLSQWAIHSDVFFCSLIAPIFFTLHTNFTLSTLLQLWKVLVTEIFASPPDNQLEYYDHHTGIWNFATWIKMFASFHRLYRFYFSSFRDMTA